MKEQVIAKAYAKSIVSLGKDSNTNVADELTSFTELINKSDDLENVLFMDVFTPEEKMGVLSTVLDKSGHSPLISNFLKFLMEEKRFGIFPMIFKEVIVIDDHNKGFMKGVIQGSASEVNEEFATKMTKYLKEKLGKEVQLTYEQSDSVTAGYRVTVEDLQVDASLDKQLDEFKHSILGE